MIHLVELETCESTNDEAARAAAAGAPHGTVIVAAAQTRGRGRLGRAWHSPPGENLYLSYLLRPSRPPAELPPITLAAGVAVCEAVAALGVAPRLKWPNDVLVGPRKLAGVLTEVASRGARVDHAIVGVGLNVATTRFPPELEATATSVARELGRPVAPAELRDGLLARLEFWLERFLAEGLAPVRPAWERWSAMAGARVRVRAEIGGHPVEGVPSGLAPDGGLYLVDDRGHTVKIMAGDVVEKV
jgi:BirA family biotin operon repressor/biotin-[acetyl-CoA-carboxylase] ligase